MYTNQLVTLYFIILFKPEKARAKKSCPEMDTLVHGAFRPVLSLSASCNLSRKPVFGADWAILLRRWLPLMDPVSSQDEEK